MIRNGIEVEFECGHKAVYDKATLFDYPEIGMPGRCHTCDTGPKPTLGVVRRVTTIRECWIETITHVHYERPTS